MTSSIRANDSNWQKRWQNYRSTITDFVRTIDYKRELTDAELTLEREALGLKAPGNTPIIAKHVGSGVYEYYTTMDMSD